MGSWDKLLLGTIPWHRCPEGTEASALVLAFNFWTILEQE